jgi:hypothetical protein
MSSRRFHMLPAISVAIALGLVALAAVIGGSFSQPERPEPAQSVALAPTDLVPSGKRSEPDAVVAVSAASIRESAPRAGSSDRREQPPHWVRTGQTIDFLSLSKHDLDARGDGKLPPDTYLKVLTAEDGSWYVHDGGDGGDRVPAEGWILKSDAVISPAPPWVVTRRATDLRAVPGSAGSPLVSLPFGAVLEVTEDLGQQLRVFYLGDGFNRDVAEGWVDASHVGPAGVVLNEEREIRLLRASSVAAIRSGGGAWINVPFRSQLDGTPAALANCGPASLGMAVSAFDQFFSTTEIREIAERLQGTNDPDMGFAIEFLAGSARRLGLNALDLRQGSALKRWTLEDVRRHLRAGHPVIPQLRFKFMPGRSGSEYLEDHYVVLTGVWGDDFIYNDPIDSDSPGYARLMDAETLDLAWRWSFAPYAAFAVSRP